MKNILSALSNSIRSARRLSCLNGAGHSPHTRRVGSALGAIAVLLLTAVSANWALAADVVWVDDAIPSGASPGGRQETWNWVATNPEPFSGSVAHQSAIAAGTHQHYFHNTHWTNRLAVSAGDTLFAYVYLDPANPPSQVMLEWNDGNWEHRAYWGANSIGWGVNGTNSRRYMGALPPLGQWVRLDVPASQVGLEGRSLSGMAFTLYNGRATWDRAGKLGVATNLPPMVNFNAPINNSTYTAPAAITLTATATDSDGTITKVEFYNGATLVGIDTSSPYSLSLSNVAAGSYAYTARAYDNTGATTNSTAVNVIVAAANVAPKVNMTGPAGGSTYAAPASVMLTAEAADSDGSIAAVEFYGGTALIGTGTLSGGSYTFTWSNVAAGSYSLRARAVDNQGASADSAPVVVTVTDPPPPPVAAGVYYVYADHLNTPRVITDGTNKVVWRWDSDPFGADAANEDPDGDGQKFSYNLRFPGQYYDRETGLHYNYFRDYEAGTGRYVQTDPIGLEGGLNIYAYVESNPLAFSDPSGLTPGGPAFLGPPLLPRMAFQRPSSCGSGGGQFPNIFNDKRVESACQEHDRCYGTCGAIKSKCDEQFRDNMLAICGADASCRYAASYYYLAVKGAGGEPFRNAQKNCQCGR